MKGSFSIALPSTAEECGYPPLEAVACGTAAVESNSPVLARSRRGYALTAEPVTLRTWIEALRTLENKDTYKIQVKRPKVGKPFLGRRG